MPKGQVRKRKQRRRLLKKHGVCRVCAPMLAHKPKGEQPARLNCVSCGRTILLDIEDSAAFDTLLDCLSAAGVCVAGYTATEDGQVKRELPCDCEKAHIEFRFGCGAQSITEGGHG
jgi:hypothetical protein